MAFAHGALHPRAEPVPPVGGVEEDLVPRADELDGERRAVGTRNEIVEGLAGIIRVRSVDGFFGAGDDAVEVRQEHCECFRGKVVHGHHY